jgi:hypothetical protein
MTTTATCLAHEYQLKLKELHRVQLELKQLQGRYIEALRIETIELEEETQHDN